MRSFFWKTLCKGKRSFLRFLNYKHRKKLQRDALESRYWSLFVPLFVKVCLKQYVGSTVARIRLRFNQYKSSVKLNGEGWRGFKIEKLIEHFLLLSHNRTHEDIKVQKIGHCDPNDQEDREDLWIFHLDTLHPKLFNQKRALK